MADFKSAVQVILGHEGGFVDHPNDPGGVTNFGVSIRFANRELDCQKWFGHPPPVVREDIVNLNRDKAIEIYKEAFWDRYGYENIQETLTATKCFDMCVNMGPFQAHKLVQRAINSFSFSPPIMVDGVLGSKSFDAINKLTTEPGGDRVKMLEAIISQQRKFYTDLVAARPEMAVFLKGWLRRAAWPF